jgi:hypothetical protein
MLLPCISPTSDMRTLGFILATAIGFVCWSLAVVLSGGVAPLGKAGTTEGVPFFTPIVLFATPLAVLAFVRGRALTGTWIGALAPILGFTNFALSMSFAFSDGSAPTAQDRPLPSFALAWCLLLAVTLAAVTWGPRLLQTPERSGRRPG